MTTQGGFSQGGFSQGGFSQGGFSQGGFSQGAYGMPGGVGFTLADGFANPITMGSLVTHRDATAEPITTSHVRPEPTRDPTALERWEPWVRATIAQQQLLSDVVVTRSGDRAIVASHTAGPLADLQAPDVPTFKRQLALVLSWAELREERASEILAQIDNQLAFLSAVVYMHPTRTPRTLELLAVAIQFAVNVEMRVKHELACWRPVEYSPQVQPMITTPGHGSLPSGHATQAYISAYVLLQLLELPEMGSTNLQLQRQAARIATNRVIAGVHFPADSMAGRMLGQALGEYFVSRALASPKACNKYAFYGLRVDDKEFHPSRQPFKATGAGSIYDVSVSGTPVPADVLAHLWTRAKDEWPKSVFT